MNSVLDSPLEALAFDYVSFGSINVVSSLWTWLAVVTAAVSFWRLRPRSLEGLNLHSPSSNDVVRCSPFPETSPPVTAEEESPKSVSAPPVAVPSSSSSSSSSCRFANDGGLTKGVKFTLYYDEDTHGDVDVNGEGELTAEESGGENWWESGLRMRTEEKSWYRYQDLRVFNGNVVRLWDDNHC